MIRTGGYFGLIGGGFIVFGGIAFIAMAHGFDPGGFLEDALGIALLILIVGIIILVVSAIGIAAYTSYDTDDVEIFSEPEMKTYSVTLRELSAED